MGVRGLAALRSLLTNKKGTSPFNFQSNEPFLKFLQQQMTIPKFLSDAFQENTRCRGGRGIHTPIPLNVNTGFRNSYYQSNEPSLKFI